MAIWQLNKLAVFTERDEHVLLVDYSRQLPEKSAGGVDLPHATGASQLLRGPRRPKRELLEGLEQARNSVETKGRDLSVDPPTRCVLRKPRLSGSLHARHAFPTCAVPARFKVGLCATDAG